MPVSARLASEQNDLELCNTNFGNAGLGAGVEVRGDGGIDGVDRRCGTQ